MTLSRSYIPFRLPVALAIREHLLHSSGGSSADLILYVLSEGLGLFQHLRPGSFLILVFAWHFKIVVKNLIHWLKISKMASATDLYCFACLTKAFCFKWTHLFSLCNWIFNQCMRFFTTILKCQAKTRMRKLPGLRCWKRPSPSERT
jgi:hypothetical protein